MVQERRAEQASGESAESTVSAQSAESALLPVWLALRGVGQADAAAADVGGKRREERKDRQATEVASSRKAKGKQRLLIVAQLAVDDEDKEDVAVDSHSLLLPPLLIADVSSPLLPLPLLVRSNEQLRTALLAALSTPVDGVPSPASSSSLAFLCAVVSSMDAAASASPSLSALLRVVLDAQASGVVGDGVGVQGQLQQWGASVREVRRLAVEQVHSVAGGAVDVPSLHVPKGGEGEEATAQGAGEVDAQRRADMDAERRARVKALAHARRLREQRGEQLQRLLASCKSLFSQGAKKD